MDAGGLAQMTYSNYNLANGNNTVNGNGFDSSGNVGMPSSGFASRGKAAHIKRLSVAPPPQIGSINEENVENPAPRTSRSHLLAGLRTAPKLNTQAIPASAPYNQTQYGFNDHYRMGQDTPQSATGATFGTYGNMQHNGSNARQMYSAPEQVLAPPAINFGVQDNSQMDPHAYNELMATNLYLAQRQQQLQQQLMNVTAAAAQFQGMNLNGQQQMPSSPLSPQASVYNQQLQNGLQPVINPVANQPGLYTVYNPMTGQSSYYFDQNVQHQQFPSSPPASGPNSSSELDVAAENRRSSLSPQSAAAAGWTRPFNPPRQSPSPPQDVAPLPAPSANAYRPGHRKSLSSVSKAPGLEGSKFATPRSAGFPQTPTTGAFGPGLGRVGEHPARQPRGPPPLEELVAYPTAKHEGSKNFATRQRRRALHSLVRANERRAGRPSSEDLSSISDHDLPSATPHDADSDVGTSGSSGSLTGHSSSGSLRAEAGGAIGSEVKQMKERPRERTSFAGRLVDSGLKSDERNGSRSPDERRKMPMLVLTSAEKRKSSMTPAVMSS